jgi:hypothetical protein
MCSLTKAHDLELLLPWDGRAERLAAAVHPRTPRRSDDACQTFVLWIESAPCSHH